MAVVGRQVHEDGDDDESSQVSAQAEPDRRDRATDQTADEENPADAPPETPSSEPASRPGPGVPLRWLLAVTAVNLLLALGLLTVRPPWRVEPAATAPPVLPSQVAQLQAQIARGDHGAPYTLALTDDDLTATVGYFLAGRQEVPFSQVRVAVVEGQVEATGVTTGLAVAVPVRVLANVQARNGAPVVQVVDVGIGGLPLPAVAREQVLREVNGAVDFSRYSLPVTVDAVELRAGVLEARGTVK